jgi:hypothetical protein
VVATNGHLDQTDEVAGKRNLLLDALLSDALEAESVSKSCARVRCGKNLAQMGTVGREGRGRQCVFPKQRAISKGKNEFET